MELTINNYLLDDFNNIKNIKLSIKKKPSAIVIYPIIKKKIVKNILTSFCPIEFQVRTSFFDFITNNQNILTILTETFKIIQKNPNIMLQPEFSSCLKFQSDSKNIVFKYSYFNKIFSGTNLLELFFYHNCFVIFLYYCNELKKSLDTNVFDDKIANASINLLKFTNSKLTNNNIITL
jgi:hypothetical protein